MFAAPRPMSSWSGVMRWRFFAARVCATEIDSTKPMIEIRRAGTKSLPIRSNERSGLVKGGRLCGTSPTHLTPQLSRRNRATKAVVTTTAATGPALVSTSASFGGTPLDRRSGLRPLRTQNRNAVAATPIKSVIKFSLVKFSNRLSNICGSEWPEIEMPRIWPIWLDAIRTPEAVIKPAITGWDRKFAIQPNRSRPRPKSMTPERNASVSAAVAYPMSPDWATLPIAAAVISDTTATGPTANAREVPKTE